MGGELDCTTSGSETVQGINTFDCQQPWHSDQRVVGFLSKSFLWKGHVFPAFDKNLTSFFFQHTVFVVEISPKSDNAHFEKKKKHSSQIAILCNN